MIKKALRGKDLQNRIYDFIDEDSVSKDYFRVDLPDKFYIGKNGFSINPTQQLLKGSAIEIDIVDIDGNYIYYEVTNIINEINSRLISVYIYPDISLGDITIYISGTTVGGFVFGWSKSISLTWQEVPTSPVYERQPTIIIQEQFNGGLDNLINVGYTSSYSNSNFLNITSKAITPNRKNDSIDSKLPNITTPLKIIDYNQPLKIRELIIGNRVSTSSILTAITTKNPVINYKNYSKISTTDSFFDRNMLGGWYYINLKDKVESLTTNLILPTTQIFKDYYSGSLLFSASIVDVIDDKNALIYPRFSYELKDYLTFDSLENYSNFTSSYSKPTTGSIDNNNHSYLYFQLHDIDPVVGKVNDIEITYNKKTDTTNPIQLIKTPITQVDLLIDANNTLTSNNGIGFKSFGHPTQNTDVSQSWAFNVFGNITASFNPIDKTSENGIIFVSHSRIYNNDYLILYTTASYDFVGLKNTMYDVQFEAWNNSELESIYQGKYGRSSVPIMDIYISGSDIQTEDVLNKSNSISSVYGNYIGSVNTHVNFITRFVPKQDSLCKLYFVIKGGIWKIRKLKVVPSKLFGFTPNVFYIKTKTPMEIQDSELNFKVNFGNNKPLIINNFFVSGTKI